MNDKCELTGFVLPYPVIVGLVDDFDQIVGFVNQDPTTVIVGYTDC